MSLASSHIAIVSASIGAGHDGAATEIGRRLTALGYPVRRMDFLDLLPGRVGAAVRSSYAAELAAAPRTWGWLLALLERPTAATTAAAIARRLSGPRMRAALASGPSVVVSTYPLASQVLGWLRLRGELAAPVVTFLTDMSVHPLWVAPGVDLHLALHPVPAQQAAGRGANVRVSRAAVAPTFHPLWTEAERAQTRHRYGIVADRPVALVVAGSWGVGEVEATMRDITASKLAVPVAVCGTNARLRDRINRSGLGLALGWVDDMAALIRASDVVVQNAGGLTSLEAMACGVPVVSYRCLAGHGLSNAHALEQAGLVRWARSRPDLRCVLQQAIGTARNTQPTITTGDDPAHLIAALTGRAARSTLHPVAAWPAPRPVPAAVNP